MRGSIFWDIHLPNAVTWFYFSLLLSVALYFKFGRLLSMRNWDVVTLFLLVPGLLFIQDGRGQPDGPNASRIWIGYLWLLSGSLYFLIRCLFDLALVRRPALDPNLNRSGLAWLAIALFVVLVTVAVRRPPDLLERFGTDPVAIDEMKQRATAFLYTFRTVSGSETNALADARFWGERTLAIVCHLAVVIALIQIGRVHFQDLTIGMAMATFYLLLPYTAIHMAQIHHVWPTALLLWAVYAYRRPTLSGLLLGLAAGSVFAPALTFPVWASFYWRRGVGRFTIAFLLAAGLSLALTALVLWLDGVLEANLRAMLARSDWQPWKQTRIEGFWTGVHWAYRLPVFILTAAFVLATFFWPTPKNLAHLIALTTAILISIQFWYADQGGVYVLWYLPLLLVMVFRPNLTDRRPPIIPPNDRIRRVWQALIASVRRPVSSTSSWAGFFSHPPTSNG